MARRQILNDLTDFGLNPKKAHTLDKTRLKQPSTEIAVETLGIWEEIELPPELELVSEPTDQVVPPSAGDQPVPASSPAIEVKEEPTKKSPPPKKKKKADSEE